MRAVLVIALLGNHAHAEPEGEVHETATRDGAHATVETSMRMRSEGAAVGVGVAGTLVRGDYALSVGIMRWQTIDENGSLGSWEASVTGHRYLWLGPRARAYVLAGASYELVERDDARLGRAGVRIGAGVSWKTAGNHRASLELTLENKRWLDVPEGVTRNDEMQVVLMFGFTF